MAGTDRSTANVCTWCHGSGEWVERKQIVPCKKCDGTGVRHG